MKIDWDNEDLLDYDIRKQMSIAAEKAVLCEGIRSECAIHVCLCDDDMITDINQKYRGISSSTDVLSFPSVDYPPGHTASQCEHRLRMEYDDESGACFLGDIIISVERAREQAKEYGHSLQREIAFLTVHGMLHLLGYDHMEEEE